MDLLGKLKAAIDETERQAKATLPGPWRVGFGGVETANEIDQPGYIYHGQRVPVATVTGTSGNHQDEMRTAAYLVRVADPTSVLRMVAAHRKILDAFEEAVTWYDANRSAPAGEVTGLRTALEALAEGYGIEA